MRREYSGNAKATTLSGAVSAAAASIAVADATGYPTGATGPFVVTIDTGLASEEKVLCLSRTGNTLTVSQRGWDDTTAADHANAATVQHTYSATDADEANAHINDAEAHSAVPPGVLQPYAGVAAPTGWLPCDGTAVSRATYADLFAAIGTTFGVGNGTTTFNVPDARGKVLLGTSGGYALGSTGGAATVTLDTTQIPSHTHAVTVNANGSHTHNVQGAIEGSATAPSGTNTGAAFNDWASQNMLDPTGAEGSHTHTGTASATGGGAAHENMMPYLAVSMIIKT